LEEASGIASRTQVPCPDAIDEWPTTADVGIP